MIIGIIQRKCNVNRKYYKLFNFILMIFVVLSCKSQNIDCNYPVIHDSVTNKNVYFYVDKMPIFPIEEGDIGRFIAKKYEDKTKAGMQFSIKLKFVIDEMGNLIGSRIANKKEREYTEEENMIIDIIKFSPKWDPGICSGIKTNVLLQIRLKFSVDENGRLK
ncbi:hypothetical protein D0T57_13620 [Dysgonomonas sp. 511]|nr:hypothetical protein [Dysgonomonas sp. 511]